MFGVLTNLQPTGQNSAFVTHSRPDKSLNQSHISPEATWLLSLRGVQNEVTRTSYPPEISPAKPTLVQGSTMFARAWKEIEMCPCETHLHTNFGCSWDFVLSRQVWGSLL